MDVIASPSRWFRLVARAPVAEWMPGSIGPELLSDGLLWLAYLTLPVVLLRFRQRCRAAPFPWLLWLFLAFLSFCAFTYCMQVATALVPLSSSGTARLVTVLSTWATVLGLGLALPRLMGLCTFQELQQQIGARLWTEVALRSAYADLKEVNLALRQ